MKTEDNLLDETLSKVYDYITKVIYTQKKALSFDDMYSGYQSMHFKPSLKPAIFKDYYYQILSDWTDRGILNKEALK